MSRGDWNYMAGRLVGDGTIEIVASELPLNVGRIQRRLTAPSIISGTFDYEVKQLKQNGRPIFEPWNTVILAVADDLIRGMGIYRQPKFRGESWQLDCVGLPGFATGILFDGAKAYVEADPLNIYRDLWAWLQSQKNGNLGLTIDATTSPVRIGDVLEQVQFQAETSPGVHETVSFEAGPRKIARYLGSDCGKEMDQLAKETPFDWDERYSWVGDSPHCHVALGYPSITRRTKMRLVLGENLQTEPEIGEEEYVNGVYALGAGEGVMRIVGYAGVTDGRVRRTKTIEDTSLRSKTAANAAAQRTLDASRGELSVETLEVYDHPNAPIDAIQNGDEMWLYAETDHALVDTTVRIIGKSEQPGKSDVMQLTVTRPTVTAA